MSDPGCAGQRGAQTPMVRAPVPSQSETLLRGACEVGGQRCAAVGTWPD